MNNPLVSIIICTHNRAGMIRETIESVSMQHYDPVEIIIIDDGSTDNTMEILAAYKGKIRFYRQENRGFSAALNAGCKKMARGEYIAINDDDDLMLPDRISVLYSALRSFPRAVLAVGDAEMMDARGNRTGNGINSDIEFKQDGPVLMEDGYKAIFWPLIRPTTCATLFKRSDGERAGWFDEGFRRSTDTDFFGRLAKLGPVVYVPTVVACFRRGHESMWSNNIKNNILCEYNNFKLYEKHLGLLDGEKGLMRERLRERMLGTMKAIAFLEHSAGEGRLQANNEGVNIKKGLSLLGMKKRLAYEWYVKIRLPLRNIIKGAMQRVRG